MSTITLRQSLFRAFLPLLINCALVLIISLLAILALQSNTSSIVTKRIPVSELAAEFVLSLDNCIGGLRKWVLTGEPNDKYISGNCNEALADKLTELETISTDSNYSVIEQTKHNLARLQRSVWYVINVAHAPGNNPARLMYERDILPVYHNIQSALTGIGSAENRIGSGTGDIELIVAITHQTLSEAVRRLSDALISGEIFEIKEFRDQSGRIEHMLERLRAETSQSADRASLLKWLDREYSAYKSLAERSLDLRHSSDWNRALYVLQSETEPLARAMRTDMDQLKIRTAHELREAAQQSVTLTKFVVIGLLLSIGVLAMLALRSSTTIAKRFDQKIKALSNAASLIGKKEFRAVQLNDDSPLELTSLATDINHSASTIDNRTKGLNQVITALKTYSQVISHDIKTPIIKMKGNISVLRETLTDGEIHGGARRLDSQEIKEIRTSLGFLDDAVTQIQKLIARIIDNSRYLLHKPASDEVELSQLTHDVLDLFASRLGTAEVTVSADISIQSDAFLIEHILINLVENAINYASPERKLTLAVTAVCSASYVDLAVADNGIGLNASDNLSEMFVRGDDNTSGYGIGLALAVSMAQQLGGELSWGNNEDRPGAVFTLRFPAQGRGNF